MRWEIIRGGDHTGSEFEPFGAIGGDILWRRRVDTPQTDVPRFVSIEDVARMFAVNVATVRRWTREKAIPAPAKIGGTLRWELDALLRFTRETGALLFVHCAIAQLL